MLITTIATLLLSWLFVNALFVSPFILKYYRNSRIKKDPVLATSIKDLITRCNTYSIQELDKNISNLNKAKLVS